MMSLLQHPGAHIQHISCMHDCTIPINISTPPPPPRPGFSWIGRIIYRLAAASSIVLWSCIVFKNHKKVD